MNKGLEVCYVIFRFERLYNINRNQGYFVTRAKSNMASKRLYSRPVDKTTGMHCDQSVILTGFYSEKQYPGIIRWVKYFNQESDKTYVFFSNIIKLDALLIAQLYKERWKIELFSNVLNNIYALNPFKEQVTMQYFAKYGCYLHLPACCSCQEKFES